MTRPPHRVKPPMHDGVSASCIALPIGPWPRVIDFLADRLPAVALQDWQARMAQGRVLDAFGTALGPDAPYQPATRVYYYRELPQEPVIPFEANILYQDAHLLVADKPHFLPVTPGGRFVQQTLLVRLKRSLGIEALSPLHRIDRETAGLVLFSLRPQDRGAYQALFRDQQVDKVYEALAPWRPELALPCVHRSRMAPDAQFFRQHEVTGEPNSETHIELLQVQGRLARYRLRPRSGRMHQLRVHMNALGIPIMGDRFYPYVRYSANQLAAEDYANPLRLLARSISFTDPVTGEPRHFESRLALSGPTGTDCQIA